MAPVLDDRLAERPPRAVILLALETVGDRERQRPAVDLVEQHERLAPGEPSAETRHHAKVSDDEGLVVARERRELDRFDLGGERRECSFVMTDLASFTSMVEQGEPAVILEILNEYINDWQALAKNKHLSRAKFAEGDGTNVDFDGDTAIATVERGTDPTHATVIFRNDPATPGYQIEKTVTAVDSAGNGVIDRDEAGGPLKDNFDAMDCDKSGTLDGAEIRLQPDQALVPSEGDPGLAVRQIDQVQAGGAVQR